MPEHDPFGIGMGVLDDTPWYQGPQFDNRRGTERSLGFCNPYGYEDMDVQVMGGVNDPGNESYHWQCRNYAQARYRMVCTAGHAGLVKLCYGHVFMLTQHHSRTKNGLCPRCAWPPRARELDEKLNHLMRQINDPRTWPDDRARMASAMEDARREMDELRQRGIIATGAPLRLEEVS
jgi:hypothetical protein